MTKKYKNEAYIKTKVGTDNYDTTISLMEKLWPNKKSFKGEDVNKLYEGLTELGLKHFDNINESINIAPKRRELNIKLGNREILDKEISKLQQEIGQ
tara:strand:- start:445 stop:735 length:291 start_codon:yes stop_codon:yes gene_type:complete